MTQDLLKIDRLVMTVNGKALCDPLSFVLSPGELIGITGPSGVGKTTLLRTIAGLRNQGLGHMLLEGRPPADWGWPEYRRRVVLVSQTPVLLDLTVEENLQRPFHYRSSREPFPKARAEQLISDLGIGSERLTQPARTLSVGQQQRVSLIRALLLNPAVLCLDEPTSALDPGASDLVQKFISMEAEKRGLAALIVTHSPQQAREWVHRAIALGAADTPALPKSNSAPNGDVQ